MSNSSKGSGALSAAGPLSVAILASRLLGLVREQVFAILFGAGNATDAFNIAFRVPNLLRNLFVEGAMSASLVPTFTRARIEEGDERAWRVAGLVFRVLTSVVGVLAAFGFFFAHDLVQAYASAFHAVPGKFELTVRMTRLLFPFFPMVALSAAFMGILNACGIFFLPALSSALFNLVSIASGVAFAKLIAHGHDFGLELQPIEGMAIGILLGGVVQVVFHLPTLYRVGYRYPAAQDRRFPPWYRDPALRRMLALMAPGVAGLAATQVNVLVNTILATSQGPGAVSWLNYAFRLMQFPIGIFGVSLATAALPAFSKLWVEKDLQGVQETLNHSLQQSLAINLPAAAGLAFIGYPIVELLFQYGHFHAADTHATAMALAMYAIGLPAYSVVKLLVPACYAFGSSRVPVLASFCAILTTTVLSLVFGRIFGFWGLALATSVGALLNCVILLVSIRSWIRDAGGCWELGSVSLSFAKNLFLALFMGVCVFFSSHVLEHWVSGATIVFRLLRVGALVLEGAVLVACLSTWMGIRELDPWKEKLFPLKQA